MYPYTLDTLRRLRAGSWHQLSECWRLLRNRSFANLNPQVNSKLTLRLVFRRSFYGSFFLMDLVEACGLDK